MPLGLGSGMWGLILPRETINLVTNPSFEYGTTGWGTLQAGTIGTTSQFQQFGAWSGSVAPTSNGTAGAVGPTFTAGNGTTYYFSACVRGANAIPYRLAVGDSAGINFVGSTTFTGGGTWARYVGSWTEASGATRRMVLTKNASADTSAFYIDAVQVEPSVYTTYIDGDQPGGTWQGQAHNATTYRSGQYRGGGSVIAIADLVDSVHQYPGAGMPPIETSIQSYAILDGAQFQRQRGKEHGFSLTFQPWSGTSLADLHRVRSAFIDAIKPDAVTPQQPVRFLYVGGMGTMQIDAYYDSGAELGQLDGPIAENAAIKFIATDPYWRAPTQEGTALVPRVNLGSVNYVARRSPLGAWGTLGANGTTVTRSAGATFVWSSAINGGGTVFFGGNFGTAGGTFANVIAMYYPITNTWGTLGPGSVTGAGSVNAIAFSPAGSVYAGGSFTTVAGTAAPYIAQWNGAGWGTLTNGTITTGAGFEVTALLWTAGTLFIGGTFSGAGGTSAKCVARWANGSFGTLTNGTVDDWVKALARGLDGRIYASGFMNTAGGTTAKAIASWNGSWGSLSGGTPDVNSVVSLSFGPSGLLYAGGFFTGFNAGTMNNVTSWNGVSYSAMANGVTGVGASAYTVSANPNDTSVLVGGVFGTAGGVKLNDALAQWNGYAWSPADIDLAGLGTVNTILRTPDRTLYIGGNFAGTAYAASVGTIVNTGKSQAYPTVRLRNTSTGTVRVYQMLNTLTNANIYFNTVLQAGEQAVLTLQPGNRSFKSDAQGNIFGQILPGSNLTTWSLLPGTNWVSFFADNSSLETSVFWTPTSWSIDSGTIY